MSTYVGPEICASGPATTAWTSPGSAALATMPTGSTVHTAVKILGPGTRFHAHPVGSPAHPRNGQANVAHAAGNMSAAPVNATLTADVTQTDTLLYPVTTHPDPVTAHPVQFAAAGQVAPATIWRPGGQVPRLPHPGQDGAWQDNAWRSGSGTPRLTTPPTVTTRNGATPATVWPMIPYPPNTYWETAGTGTTAGTGASLTNAGGTSATGGTAESAASGTAVPVFNSSGGQVGVAVTSQATGVVELVGPGGAVLGVVRQQNGAVDLVGAGGAVLGSFAANQANGTVIFTPAMTSVGTSGSTTGSVTTTGTATTTATSGTAVPVFNSSGGQVGVAVTSQATGVVEFVSLNGNLLGVIVQRNGAVDLVGAGGAVLGSFAANQANGTVIYTPAAAGTAAPAPAAATAAGTAAPPAAPTTQGVASSVASVPVFNSSGGQVGVAVTNQATGVVELVGPGGAVLGVVRQQNGAVYLVGASGAVLGGFAVNQANGQLIITTAG